VAYGDDFASSAQRWVASAAVLLAVLELAYCWLVAGMMAAAPNPRLMAISMTLAAIIVANGVLLFGRRHAPNHWLRIISLASTTLMIGLPAALALAVVWHSGS
jgi:hypothetical protein